MPEPKDIKCEGGLSEFEAQYLEGLWKNSDDLWKKRQARHMELLEKSTQIKKPPLMIEYKSIRK